MPWRSIEEEDTPRDYELWVDANGPGEFLANRLKGVYRKEKERAISALEDQLKRKSGFKFKVRVVDVTGDDDKAA